MRVLRDFLAWLLTPIATLIDRERERTASPLFEGLDQRMHQRRERERQARQGGAS